MIKEELSEELERIVKKAKIVQAIFYLHENCPKVLHSRYIPNPSTEIEWIVKQIYRVMEEL